MWLFKFRLMINSLARTKWLHDQTSIKNLSLFPCGDGPSIISLIVVFTRLMSGTNFKCVRPTIYNLRGRLGKAKSTGSTLILSLRVYIKLKAAKTDSLKPYLIKSLRLKGRLKIKCVVALRLLGNSQEDPKQ